MMLKKKTFSCDLEPNKREEIGLQLIEGGSDIWYSKVFE